MKPRFISAILISLASAVAASSQPLGNEQFQRYLESETLKLSRACLVEVQTLDDWNSKRAEYRRQLQEMLGLLPLPKRTDLKATITGKLDHDAFTVEKLHFQALPGLYCTAALFIPKRLKEPAPTILYACGHWRVFTNGISYGNKAAYQADGAWYAQNGYVCLVLDTVLSGEIPGIHTGTRDRGLWWWNSRGYTPAGVEAWFGMRALDYLTTRPEVDTNRFGITGHSGGGAYSWMITALDDRIKAAAPLAGMADARSHALDPVMDSHCDCNFFVNYHRWDFPQVAALAAPRPLLIGATDNDRLFNLPNTLRIHEQVRRIYQLHNAISSLGLAIAPGGHDEVPELQLAAMRWFNRHLKGVATPVETAAKRFFEAADLKVFETLPSNAINTNIADSFVPLAPAVQRSADGLRAALRERPFSGWPVDELPLQPELKSRFVRDEFQFRIWKFQSEAHVQLELFLVERTNSGREAAVTFAVLDQPDWGAWTNWFSGTAAGTTAIESALQRGPVAFFAPRGLGADFWPGDEKAQTKIRRRFMLLGKTRDGMRVWDVRRAIQTLHAVREDDRGKITLMAHGDMAVNSLYAALFEPNVRKVEFSDLPSSHRFGPDYLGILTISDIPEVLSHMPKP